MHQNQQNKTHTRTHTRTHTNNTHNKRIIKYSNKETTMLFVLWQCWHRFPPACVPACVRIWCANFVETIRHTNGKMLDEHLHTIDMHAHIRTALTTPYSPAAISNPETQTLAPIKLCVACAPVVRFGVGDRRRYDAIPTRRQEQEHVQHLLLSVSADAESMSPACIHNESACGRRLTTTACVVRSFCGHRLPYMRSGMQIARGHPKKTDWRVIVSFIVCQYSGKWCAYWLVFKSIRTIFEENMWKDEITHNITHTVW